MIAFKVGDWVRPKASERGSVRYRFPNPVQITSINSYGNYYRIPVTTHGSDLLNFEGGAGWFASRFELVIPVVPYDPEQENEDDCL